MKNRLAHYRQTVQIFTAKAITFHEAVAESLGLHLTDLKVLRLIGKEALTPGTLVSQTGLTGAAMTALLDRLEEAQFISRERDKNDRRKVIIRLTPQKSVLIENLYNHLGQEMDSLLKRYSDREFSVIIGHLAKASESLSNEILRLRSTSKGKRN